MALQPSAHAPYAQSAAVAQIAASLIQTLRQQGLLLGGQQCPQRLAQRFLQRLGLYGVIGQGLGPRSGLR